MSPSARTTIEKELLNARFLCFTFFIAILYIILSLYLPNYRLIISTVTENAPLTYKATLLTELITGGLTAFTLTDTILILLDAVLVGANVVLLVRTMRKLRQQGALELSVGGAAILGLVTAGCSSCGFSALALLGLSTSFSFLPFKGLELHILATVMLFISLAYMLKKLHEKVYCKMQ
jgi:hypothetical protein